MSYINYIISYFTNEQCMNCSEYINNSIKNGHRFTKINKYMIVLCVKCNNKIKKEERLDGLYTCNICYCCDKTAILTRKKMCHPEVKVLHKYKCLK